MNSEKISLALARFFSTVMSPLLTPAYGLFLALWTSVLCYLPAGTRIVITWMILGITGVLPLVLVALLHNVKYIENKDLFTKSERWLPYAFTTLCHVGAAFYLQNVHAPLWLVFFMAGSSTACFLAFIINFWWKISAHAMGMGSLLALMFAINTFGLGAFDLFWIICALILLSGCVCTSRIMLQQHNFLQVLAGFALGYVSVFFFVILG